MRANKCRVCGRANVLNNIGYCRAHEPRLGLADELGVALMGVALLFLAFYAMGGFR